MKGMNLSGLAQDRGGRVQLVMHDSIISVVLCIQNLGAVPSDCVAWRKFFKKV